MNGMDVPLSSVSFVRAVQIELVNCSNCSWRNGGTERTDRRNCSSDSDMMLAPRRCEYGTYHELGKIVSGVLLSEALRNLALGVPVA
jgi:hypothetical protein